jgi:hypothetical protein
MRSRLVILEMLSLHREMLSRGMRVASLWKLGQAAKARVTRVPEW